MWEAYVTFMFFPILVLLAYAQDRNWFRSSKTSEESDEEEMQQHPPQPRRNTKILTAELVDCTEEEVRDIVKNTKSQHGMVTEESVSDEFFKHHPPKLNRGHYRINAIRNMVSKAAVIRAVQRANTGYGNKVTPEECSKTMSRDLPGAVEFVTTSYSVLEGDGDVTLKLHRVNGSSGRITARYKTQDLTAMDGVHYVGKEGTVVYEDGEAGETCIKVPIIDNDVRNADTLFTCSLETDPSEALGTNKLTVVTIIDDDLPGEIRFAQPSVIVQECNGSAKVEVIRENGSTGSITVQYRTLDGVGPRAAQAPEDYTSVSGTLHFAQGESKKVIDIPVVDDSQYEKEEHFFVLLTAVESKAGGKLGSLTKCRVNITSDERMTVLVKHVLEKVKSGNVNEKISTDTWGQQFRDAMNIGGGEEEPSTMEYFMHALTFFWKVLFACVPPTAMAGGWACFGVALFFIGLVTAMVAEVASLLGCVMGLKDGVTAITFVALGTSLPDTFASKQAAENEDYADAAIGNVTGSNSVNVFLGLGLPWIIASSYYEAKGECFIVPAGSLGFGVTVFTICGVVAIAILFALRFIQGGELGGPLRKPISAFLVTLWLMYIVLSSLQEYGHISFPGTSKKCPCGCSNRGILPWSIGTGEGNCLAAGCPLV
eukprot:TRINITY_DN18068_c0_g1_i1.p1 TRINITY_DN18068_c0_g1~~TRINITY_DN18068_c0_g1_i1.p1  ORF type:complete len:748 (+),score=264.15 TRINITY_DN18068_c0_g1_i1:285-2246(+)